MPKARTKTKHPVAKVSEVAPGERKLVDVQGKSIGVFNVNGSFVAVLNYCPHEGAPVCLGKVSGTTLPSPPGEYYWGREGEVLTCPWHGWEFDLLTGTCLTDKRKLRKYPVSVETFPVDVEQDTIFVTV